MTEILSRLCVKLWFVIREELALYWKIWRADLLVTHFWCRQTILLGRLRFRADYVPDDPVK